MTLNELRFQVYEALNINADDTDIDPRFIDIEIANQRSLWLRNEYNKARQVNEDAVQDLGCVDLEQADPAECCVTSSGCVVLRTEKKIPDTIEYHHKNGLTRIGPIDKTRRPYDIIPYSRVPYFGHGKFNQGAIVVTYYNNRVYVISKTTDVQFIEQINIRGVFEDPVEAATFEECSTKDCWTPDSEYPLTSWMWTYIKPLVIETMSRKMVLPKDNENDGEAIEFQTAPQRGRRR